MFTAPVMMEHPRGRWVNIYDKDDPIGMPLKTLNAAYDQAVLKDVQADAGDYLISHLGYFSQQEILGIMARKISLDWVAANHPLPADQIEQLYEAYDKSLTFPTVSQPSHAAVGRPQLSPG
jgi:hypothetical protein